MNGCAVQGCAEPVKRRGWCYGHYMKWWRYGSPTPVHSSRREDLTNQRFGTLTAREPAGPHWLCDCDCGRTRVVSVGDLHRYGDRSTCGVKRAHLSAAVGYGTAHERIRETLGPASARECVDCGEQARHWSYDHADPRQLVSTDPATIGAAYSLDSTHYEPRCVSCHKLFDLGRVNTATKAA